MGRVETATIWQCDVCDKKETTKWVNIPDEWQKATLHLHDWAGRSNHSFIVCRECASASDGPKNCFKRLFSRMRKS